MDMRPPAPAGRAFSRLRLATLVCVAVLVLAGCGTKSVANEILVSVDRASGAVGSGPVEVGVFDTTMGRSSDYARRFAGTATESEPYRGVVPTTVTRMIGDSSPPERLDLGLWIPAIEPKGFFAVSITPETGAAAEMTAPFVADHAYDAAIDGPVDPLRLTVAHEAVGDAWRVTISAHP